MALKDSRYSLEAEQAVVGSLLVAGSRGDTETIRDLLFLVQEEDLLNQVDKAIFQAARTLFRAGGAVDPLHHPGSDWQRVLRLSGPAHGNHAHHRQLAGVGPGRP